MMLDMMKKDAHEMPSNYITRIDSVFHRYVSNAMPIFNRDTLLVKYIELYSPYLTEIQIKNIIKFYKSSDGVTLAKAAVETAIPISNFIQKGSTEKINSSVEILKKELAPIFQEYFNTKPKWWEFWKR